MTKVDRLARLQTAESEGAIWANQTQVYRLSRAKVTQTHWQWRELDMPTWQRTQHIPDDVRPIQAVITELQTNVRGT